MDNKMDDVGWQWFERLTETSPEKAGQTDIGEDIKACFATQAGKRVLFHLMDKTMGRAVSGHVQPALLSHLEGQRYLVSYLLSHLRAETVNHCEK